MPPTMRGNGKAKYMSQFEVADPATDWKRSNPDVVVYLPRGGDTNDGDNEHFLVFEAPRSGELLAMWTQSSVEAHGDNHIVLARSGDGINWSEPAWIVGTHKDTSETQASWGFPVVTRGGRIYCFYTKSDQGVRGGGSGVMGGLYSDDDGRTWTGGSDIIVPSTLEDPSDQASPEIAGLIVWQLPIRNQQGLVLAGYTRSIRKSALSSLHFMRFDNIDDDPEIADIEISWFPSNPAGVSLPRYVVPQGCEEPSIALLPDGRLFTTMRTKTGFIWYTVSSDGGESWREPQTLRYEEDGEPIKHPLAPCPIYPLDDGRYVLLFHNNDHFARHELYGDELPRQHPDVHTGTVFAYRRPAFICVGEYHPRSHQPIWFSRPKQILDTGGVPVGPKSTDEIATYTSLTRYKGRRTLWYPDRKHYLLGMHINDEMLTDMKPAIR